MTEEQIRLAVDQLVAALQTDNEPDAIVVATALLKDVLVKLTRAAARP